MMDLVELISRRGDLAHLVLFLWAASSTALLIWTMRALLGATLKFDEFIREIQRLNLSLGSDEWP
ncbi:hypothetical protein E1162_07405 [Rhodobacteraceae bacterium RKSG542]|uniref:hypothetical protein n=1 Tax=Pseudovibrio flavus TaxID=2529854 RepID=UPI0012BBA3DE|nr:hypothetical protein [Pseudovibrio flavus]MTI17064.1 hypothetical protein [Pseudovibrio flavus]